MEPRREKGLEPVAATSWPPPWSGLLMSLCFCSLLWFPKGPLPTPTPPTPSPAWVLWISLLHSLVRCRSFVSSFGSSFIQHAGTVCHTARLTRSAEYGLTWHSQLDGELNTTRQLEHNVITATVVLCIGCYKPREEPSEGSSWKKE